MPANGASKLTLKVSNRSNASVRTKEIPGFGRGFLFVKEVVRRSNLNKGRCAAPLFV
jgi:hypothetical protein